MIFRTCHIATYLTYLTYLQFMRKLTNETFTYLILYVNSKKSGVSVRSQKDKVAETYSYSQGSLEVADCSVLWKLQDIKNKKLLKVGKKLKKIAKREMTGFTFISSSHCLDYINYVDSSAIQTTPLCIVSLLQALKSRPMRRLRFLQTQI